MHSRSWNPQLYSPSDLRWKFGGIWTLNHSSPLSLLRMTVQCQPVLQSCTLRGTRTPSGLHAQPFRRVRSQARHLRYPRGCSGEQATPMVWGEQDGSWALGLSGVCTSMHAHRSTCTRVYTHTHTHIPTGWRGRPGGWGCSHRGPHSSPLAPHGGGVINI